MDSGAIERQTDDRAVFNKVLRVGHGGELNAGRSAENVALGAEALNEFDADLEVLLRVLGEVVGVGMDVVRTDAEEDLFAEPRREHGQPGLLQGQRQTCLAPALSKAQIRPVRPALKHRLGHVHLRRADEGRDKEVAGAVKKLLRRRNLLDITVFHDDNARAHCHGLGLVVRDVNEGRLQFTVKLCELGAHRRAELRVEVRQRLVEQKHLGVSHDGAAERDALALAAGERGRLALQQVLDLQNARGLGHALADLRARRLADFEAEGHVVEDRHVRIERVVLKNHRDVAVLRRDVVHARAVDVEVAARNVLETCDHAQSCGLAAAGRPDKNDELPVLDLHIEIRDGDHAARIGFGNALQCDTGHKYPPEYLAYSYLYIITLFSAACICPN